MHAYNFLPHQTIDSLSSHNNCLSFLPLLPVFTNSFRFSCCYGFTLQVCILPPSPSCITFNSKNFSPVSLLTKRQPPSDPLLPFFGKLPHPLESAAACIDCGRPLVQAAPKLLENILLHIFSGSTSIRGSWCCWAWWPSPVSLLWLQA